jgi:hypothetical protein
VCGIVHLEDELAERRSEQPLDELGELAVLRKIL